MNDTTTIAAALAACDLASFVEHAWDAHAKHPEAVAAALRARAESLAPDEASDDVIALGEHVWLAHLTDPGGFAAYLDKLPPAIADTPPTSAIVRRGRWVLAALDERAAPVIPDGDRWRALQSLWSVWVARGRAAQALAMLRNDVSAALAHPDASARRGLAATCNNLAVELRVGRRGDGARDALMLALAEASRALWGTAGTWVHAERAEYQLARCHAVLGNGERALAHAQACQDAIDAHRDDPQADAFERFFAHEALAWAQLTRAKRTAAAQERGRMAALAVQVVDEAMRAWCDEALRDFDAAVSASAAAGETC